MTSGVAGIVLAAGRSTRMGRNKMLMAIDGVALVRRSAQSAISAGLVPVVVVTGHDHELVQDALDGLPVTFAQNPEPSTSPGRSFQIGLAALPPTALGAVLILADMPAVTSAMIAAVGTALRQAGHVVLSRYGKVIAPPHGIAAAIFAAALAAPAEAVLRRVAEDHSGRPTYLQWPAETMRDLDTEEDVRSFLA